MIDWARVFLFVGLHFTFKNFSSVTIEEKIIEFNFETHKIIGIAGVIYVDDVYSKKDVNLSPRDY